MKKWMVLIVACIGSLCAMDDIPIGLSVELDNVAEEELTPEEILAAVMIETGCIGGTTPIITPNHQQNRDVCPDCDNIAANDFAGCCVKHVGKPIAFKAIE